nr:L-lactate permease [Pseudomonadota bacterium]
MAAEGISGALLAGLPILTILVLMLAFHWSAARAGLTGLGLALVLAWTVFGFGGAASAAAASGGALAEAVFTAATILWIIFPALCIHQLQLRTGAIDVIRRAIGGLSPDPRLTAILVAWFFALFIEGAAGFGTTIALAAPFLVSVGFQPVAAVAMVLIGHAVGVSFGAVGTPIVPQIEATGLSGGALARATAVYHALLGWVLLFAAVWIAGRALAAAPPGRIIWLWTLLAAVLFLLPYFLIAWFVGPELPTLGGALVGAAGFTWLLTRRRPLPESAAAVMDGPKPPVGLMRAAAPYLALIVLVLVTRLAAPVQEALYGIEWTWSLFGEFGGGFRPLYQPGTLLLLAFLIGAAVQRAGRAAVGEAARAALARIAPVTVALVAMLGLSRVLVHAGMIDALALAAARAAGDGWPLLAPLVGVLGTFVTGSATASNILFTDFQQATAQNLHLPVLAIAAAQG